MLQVFRENGREKVTGEVLLRQEYWTIQQEIGVPRRTGEEGCPGRGAIKAGTWPKG